MFIVASLVQELVDVLSWIAQRLAPLPKLTLLFDWSFFRVSVCKTFVALIPAILLGIV